MRLVHIHECIPYTYIHTPTKKRKTSKCDMEQQPQRKTGTSGFYMYIHGCEHTCTDIYNTHRTEEKKD